MEYIQSLAPDARTLLEVGGGVTRGCRYLAKLPRLERRSVEIHSRENRSLKGVEVVCEEFMAWQPAAQSDVVLCLQVLEHIPDAAAFAEKLFACAMQLVVISVPYLWAADAHASHCHDPVDADKLRIWTGRDPIESVVVDRSPYRRLVAVYGVGGHPTAETPCPA